MRRFSVSEVLLGVVPLACALMVGVSLGNSITARGAQSTFGATREMQTAMAMYRADYDTPIGTVLSFEAVPRSLGSEGLPDLLRVTPGVARIYGDEKASAQLAARLYAPNRAPLAESVVYRSFAAMDSYDGLFASEPGEAEPEPVEPAPGICTYSCPNTGVYNSTTGWCHYTGCTLVSGIGTCATTAVVDIPAPGPAGARCPAPGTVTTGQWPP